MASLAYLLILTLLSYSSNHASGRHPPSPGYYPSSSILPTSFPRGFETLWGPQHQTLHHDILTLWLDRSSGSGFKSRERYDSGYFGASIKLQKGFTAGVITSFYLSNNEDYPGHHDEIDIELLGTIPGEPYTLQTNVYIRGSGDPGNVIGREMKFHLWFDPARHFHNYSILWTPTQIVFFVDDVPIRRYPRKSEATFPMRPMWVYGSIWDASSWATDNGKHPADYRYEPFVSRYRDFRLHGSPQGFVGLTSRQEAAMDWVQNNFLVYNYCIDTSRNHALTPEC